MKVTLAFGESSWRIESEPIESISNLRLFADNKLVFEGRYGELINKITYKNT